MRISKFAFRVTGIILLTCFLQMTMIPSLSVAQTPECHYDKANPSIENARISFKSLSYGCAELEIEDFLKLETITTEQRADAHVLLAAVYYAKSKNEDEKRILVINQFKEAFRTYREWRGELDINSSEFSEMMNEAQVLVDKETTEEQVIAEPVVEKPVYTESTVSEDKPWYKKWWAIGLGVGLVAGTVVILSGGGSDDGDDGGGGGVVNDTLPDFPNTP